MTTVDTLREMLALFALAISLCLIIALIAIAIVQLIRPVLRGWMQYRMLKQRFGENGRSWLDTDESRFFELPDWIGTAFPGGPHLDDYIGREGRKADKRAFPRPVWHLLLRSNSDGHLMKQVQDGASLVLARPSVHTTDFYELTRDAPREDRNTILFLDFVSRSTPERIAKLMNTEKGPMAGFAEAVGAAQQSVNAAVEKKLDQLQLDLAASQSFYVRYLAIGAGMSIAAVGAFIVSPRNALPPLVIGALGGLLASLFLDAASAIMARRR